MEQHPVPQNVTTFQFRLIGDMTIKQFGYLAAGAIVAYLCYKLPLPFYLNWPLVILSALTGVGLAFVPVEDRPMDVWVLSFFKNIYQPTMFVWEKTGPPAPEEKPKPLSTQASAVPRPEGSTWVTTLQKRVSRPTGESAMHDQPEKEKNRSSWWGVLFASPASSLTPATRPVKHADRAAIPSQAPVRHGDPFAWLRALFSGLATSGAPRMAQPPTSYVPVELFSATPLVLVTGKKIDIGSPLPQPNHPQKPAEEKPVPQIQTEKTVELETKITKMQEELKVKETSEARILELQKQLTDALSQSGRLENEIVKMRQQAAAKVFSPVVYPPTVVRSVVQAPTVRVVSAESAANIGLPKLTTFPNIVTGIVKDNTNNLLPGVLVTVRDKDDVPLRALKTNKLGQFAASTPLPNDIYVIEVEDPRKRYVFDRAQITLQGIVLPAIEIIAKSQKQVQREELAKQVFGQTV